MKPELAPDAEASRTAFIESDESGPPGAAPRPPFTGWTAVELSDGYGPATLAGKLLADLGCSVRKIEEPSGDSLRMEAARRGVDLFTLVSGSKVSVVIDTAHPRADEPLRAILSNATILIVDQPGWTKLCTVLRCADPHTALPHLTLCRCSPFGRTGRMAGWRGGEEIVQAVSGVMSTTGHPHAGPTRVGAQVLTHAAAMFAVTAIIADAMRSPGCARGRLIDMATFDAAIAFMTAALPYNDLHKAGPIGIGNRHTMAAPWNSYQCTDGWLILCAGNDPTWHRLCHAIGRPDLRSDARFDTQEDRVRNTEALDMEISRWTRERSVAESERILEKNGIPSGPILAVRDVVTHPQFIDRSMLRQVNGASITGGVFRRNGETLPVHRATWKIGDGSWHALRQAGAAVGTIAGWAQDKLIPAQDMGAFGESAA